MVKRIVKGLINNIRIKYKFIIFFSFIFFLFISFTTYILFTRSYSLIVEKKNETYLQNINQTNRNIVFTLNSYEKILNTFFLNKSFRESLVQEFANIAEQLDFQTWVYNYVDSLTLNYEPLPSIKIYTGNESLKVDNRMFFSLNEFKSTEWYNMVHNRPERINIHRWLNTIKRRKHESDFYIICGLVEILDVYTKEKIAVITIEIDVKQLFSFLDTPNNKLVITDDRGNIIYSNDSDIITTNISANEYFSVIKNEENGSFVTKIDGNSMMIFYNTINPMGWRLINIVEESFFLNETLAVRKFAIFLAILGIVTSIIITFVYVTIITKRIMILTKAMTEVGKGNFEVSVSIAGSDEIGKMNDVFINMVQDTKKLIEKVRTSENSLYRFEIMSMQEQIKPHFLYNTLSAIGLMAIDIEAYDIYSALLSLSEYYKISLSNGDIIIPIKNEIIHIKAYVNLLKLRFANKFNVDYFIDESVYEYYTPKTILQPIIENSVIHGFYNKKSETNLIRIKVFRKNDNIIYEISDNGVGIAEDRIKEIFNSNSESFALKNIDSRIKLICGNKYGLDITSIPGEGTTTNIKLPLINK